MVSKNLRIVNPQGLTARAASQFATVMGRYACHVTLIVGEDAVNGKSLMNILAANIKCGDVIEVICDGPEEEKAFDEARKMIEGGFGE